jgi:hypothetical protein
MHGSPTRRETLRAGAFTVAPTGWIRPALGAERGFETADADNSASDTDRWRGLLQFLPSKAALNDALASVTVRKGLLQLSLFAPHRARWPVVDPDGSAIGQLFELLPERLLTFTMTDVRVALRGNRCAVFQLPDGYDPRSLPPFYEHADRIGAFDSYAPTDDAPVRYSRHVATDGRHVVFSPTPRPFVRASLGRGERLLDTRTELRAAMAALGGYMYGTSPSGLHVPEDIAAEYEDRLMGAPGHVLEQCAVRPPHTQRWRHTADGPVIDEFTIAGDHLFKTRTASIDTPPLWAPNHYPTADVV